MLKRGNIILLALALVLALATTLLIMRQMSTYKTQSAPKVEMKSVVLVHQTLAAYQPITTADVQLGQIPANALEPGVATSLSQVIGQYSTTNWIVGQQVITGMYGDGKSVTFAASIPPGQRAFTVSDSPTIGVDHLISPGDHVDVVVTGVPLGSGKSTTSQTITISDLLVLFVDQVQPAANPANPKPSSSTGGDTITFAVTPQQATQLMQLEAQGQIHLLLRNPADH